MRFVLPLAEFMLELYPSSVNGKVQLAEAEIMLKNYPAAIRAYEQLQTQFPSEPAIKARLDWLRSQR